jgi:hypothetical protein
MAEAISDLTLTLGSISNELCLGRLGGPECSGAEVGEILGFQAEN